MNARIGCQMLGISCALAVLQLPFRPLAAIALCVGDCGIDGQVTVDEISTMVAITLGQAPLSSCAAADADGDDEVAVNELVSAVTGSLLGCPPTATPEPSRTSTSTVTPTRNLSSPTPRPTSIATPTRTPTVSGDSYEPDDRAETAKSITCGETQTRLMEAPAVSGPRAQDWVRFDLTAPATAVRLRLTQSNSTTTIHHSLQTEYGSLLGAESTSTIERSCDVNALSPGRYRLLLEGDRRTDYTLALECEPCERLNPTPTPTLALDDYEPDGLAELATKIECGEGQWRTLTPGDDYDWVKFHIPEASGLTAVSFQLGSPSLFTLEARMFRHDPLLPPSFDDPGITASRKSCGINALPPGDYLFAVRARSEEGNYLLSLACGPCIEANPEATPTPTQWQTPTPSATPPATPTRTPTVRTPTPAIDRYEPDDTAELAKPIACGETQQRSSSGPSDVDWLIFEVEEPSSAVAVFEGGSLGYRVQSEFGTPIFDTSRCSDPLPPGTYRMRVQPSTRRSYSLRLDCTPCFRPTATPVPALPDAYEIDDHETQASRIECGAQQIHTLHHTSDRDMMTFDLDKPSAVTIRSRAHGTNVFGSVALALADSDLRGIVADERNSSPSADLQTSCARTALEPGKYYIAAFPGTGVRTANGFSVSLDCEPCTEGTVTPTPTVTKTPTVAVDTYESDDSLEQAKPIACGEIQTRTLTQGDVDWATIEVPRVSEVLLLATTTAGGSGPVDVRFTDEDGVLISGIEVENRLHRRCLTDPVEAGTYGVRVYNAGEPTRRYELSAWCIPCNQVGQPTPTPSPEPTQARPDTFEPDGSPSLASEIACGERQIHSMGAQEDTDWLRFELSEPSAVEISMSVESAGDVPDTVATLFDAYLSFIAFNDDGGPMDLSRIVRTCDSEPLPPGDHFLRVSGYGGGQGSADFAIGLTCSPCSATPISETPTPTPTPTQSLPPPSAFHGESQKGMRISSD